MTEEDCWDSDSSSEESDVFSQNKKTEEYVSRIKENISSGDSMTFRGNRYTPVRGPMSVSPDMFNQCVKFPPKARPRTDRTSCFVHKRTDPSHKRAVRNASLNDVLTLLPMPLPRRKTRQQLQKEKEAAITIQSAWRGYQIRRDMEKLNEAATNIQAAFRGYMTRKALPLGLCSYGRTTGSKFKEAMRTENKSRPFPVLLGSLQQLDLASGAHTGSHSIFPTNGKPRSYPNHIKKDDKPLHPKVTCIEVDSSAFRPSRKMLTCSAFDTGVQKQKYRDAATTIQAAWRGYQERQKIRLIVQAKKSFGKSFCSNFTIRKIYRKRAMSGHTLEEHEVRGIFTKSEPHGIARIRNINICAVVKGKPASQRSNVSIQVSSPNAEVQGYQRDMSMGTKGFYTAKNNRAQRPSQILIHVHLQKENEPINCPP
ncbi:IQ domain-containing protein N-like [Hemicordylus capensis]|uniref:IQ domain-containing protein N-like n=1 Tax=Hemicordylus capensis TaxID=884348 RepID=UPI002302F5F9|nr:IQ domain-containing protein N-like [Hemicordylus capensis]XP_053149715.1 IQ domain-containing protein N-like [Hemicordylus capensis]XP_053149717.1 IQ domain-containing protein N-like [Hemicordylus capensis]